MELSLPVLPPAGPGSSFAVSLHICGKSPEALPPGHVFGPVTGGTWLLQYCTTGRGIMEVEGREIPLQKGDCILTFPGQTRYERADNADPWGFLWLSFQGESAGRFFEKMELTRQDPVLPGCAGTKIPELMEEIVAAADAAGLQNDFLLGARIFRFFDSCLRIRQGLGKNAPTGGYVERAIAYLNAQYTRQELTVAELARFLGLNRSYLYEIFKGDTGLSPQEYLTRLRIRKSCELLQLPQTTAADAAYSVGYEPSVFAKAFKRAMGMTPGQYKRNYKQ